VVNHTVELFPHSIAIGDLTGDGLLDMVSANRTSSTLSVLAGNGMGTLGPETDYPVGSNPIAVAVGDLNGDGLLDMAAARIDSGSVAVFLAAGFGGFGSAARSFSAGAGPNSIAVGDLNNDGRPDMASTNSTVIGTVTVLLNQGSSPTLPAPFCFGDGTGAGCPCANIGAAGKGCANSSFPGGTHLAALGIASVVADTLVLAAHDIPGPGLFFQGTGQFAGGTGISFGDGLLCAGGTITRMGVVFPSGASASYPGGLTPNPIHVAGATVAGDVRHYQCWYRDAGVFCTARTSNLTQGLTVIWGS